MPKEEKNLTYQLSPPWYIYSNKIRYTYGLSDLIQVNDLIGIGGNYHLTINAFDDDVALSLRQILPLTMAFGNVTVYITIFNTKGKQPSIMNDDYPAETLAQLYFTALKSNPLFIGTILTENLVPPLVAAAAGDVVVVIDKFIVQFFNDDITDISQNYNEVAAKVFKEISISSFSKNLTVGFSTYCESCEYHKNLSCR